MFRKSETALIGALLLATSLAALPAAADHLNRSYVEQGVVVDVGLMSASKLREQVRKYPQNYPNHETAGIPEGRHMHHVNVILFDKLSGVRIKDAAVSAWVTPLGLAGTQRKLEPMLTAGVIEYCNYFKMWPGERYRIDLDIRRPGRQGAITLRVDNVTVH